MTITLDPSVKASDILTSLTIIVSVLALILTWAKDRRSRDREQADRLRAAAAQALAKLERWQALQRSLYSELQPVYVETSELLVKNFNVVVARDFLWKQINLQRVHIAGRILDEAIETAYVDLFSYRPAVRQVFLSAVDRLKAVQEAAIYKLLDDTQAAVMSFMERRSGYTTAMLGNDLRDASAAIEQEFIKSSDTILEPIRNELYELISTTDETLLNGPKLK